MLKITQILLRNYVSNKIKPSNNKMEQQHGTLLIKIK